MKSDIERLLEASITIVDTRKQLSLMNDCLSAVNDELVRVKGERDLLRAVLDLANAKLARMARPKIVSGQALPGEDCMFFRKQV